MHRNPANGNVMTFKWIIIIFVLLLLLLFYYYYTFPNCDPDLAIDMRVDRSSGGAQYDHNVLTDGHNIP